MKFKIKECDGRDITKYVKDSMTVEEVMGLYESGFLTIEIDGDSYDEKMAGL